MNNTHLLPASETKTDFAAFVAIDWADQAHAIALVPAQGQTIERLVLPHSPQAVADWVSQLLERFPGGPIAIIMEQSRGALLYALLPYERLQIYPINPKTSAKFREAFSVSGPKSDPLDAGLMLDILLHHRDRLRPWQPEEPLTRQLQLLVEARRGFVADQVRLRNRLKSALKLYFPQALELVGEDPATLMACAFLRKWPTLELARKARGRLRQFYYAHHCRSEQLIAHRLELLAQAQALTTDWAVIEAQSVQVQSLARQLAVLPAIIAQYDELIEQRFQQHADFALWDSFPGAGPALAPRLAAAWGTQRERFAQSQAMGRFSGIAPVKEASGRSCWIHMRWACPKFLRQSFHEMAAASISFCVWAQCYYRLQRQRGKGHQSAVRALAFKWQRIMWRCWQDRVLYDEAKYLLNLKRAGSKLYDLVMAVGQCE